MRYAIRGLRRDPGLALLVTLTLALGVGINSVIFSVVNGLHRPLPVQDPQRLVVLATRHNGGGSGTEAMQYRFTYPALADFRAQSRSYSDLIAFDLGRGGISTGEKAREFVFSYVSGNYFSALGVRPAAGRLFVPGEGEAPDTNLPLVLGYTYWQERFGGDTGVVGRQIRISGAIATIVGVAERRFTGTYANADLHGYVPLSYLTRSQGRPGFFHDRSAPRLTVMGLLKPGVTRAQAASEATVIAARLERQFPDTDKGISVAVIPETWARPAPIPAMVATGPLITVLFLMLGGLVLVLACLNVSNLLLVRAAAREHEMAIRAALGSGRARLLVQVLAESVMLAALGGIAGALLSAWATDAVSAIPMALGNLRAKLDLSFDWRVFAYALAATLLAGTGAGLWPALSASRTKIAAMLHESGRSASSAPGARRGRNLLVIAQVAASLALLIAAGSFIQGLANARRSDLGFDPHHLANFVMDTSYAGYGRDQSVSFYEELRRRARDIPGVDSAALAYSMPLNYVQDGDSVQVEGRPVEPGRRPPLVLFNSVTPEYFATMHISLRKGREFSESDQDGSPRVAIINETMARRLWPDQDPIGRRFRMQRTGNDWWEVAGIAANARYFALFEPPLPYFYVPAAQMYHSRRVLQVRSAMPASTLMDRVQQEIRLLDPEMPVSEAQMMDDALEGATGFWGYRLGAWLSGVMGFVGLALAMVGVYGVVSYAAKSRTREIGIRMALGASGRDIHRLILGRSLMLVGMGVLAGMSGAWLMSILMSRALPGTISANPPVFLSAGGFLALVALCASYIPARRATHLDAARALRHE